MEVLEILRIILGFLVFFASGWFACNALFGKDELELVEKIALSLTLALVIPTVLMLFANLALGTRLNEFTAYAAYIFIAIASFAYRKFDLSAFLLR